MSQKVLQARILTRGMGPNAPIASNDTPEGRALNRRVEIILTPIT
jgi:outer membrane protein OmpA-like peptidoglycan-associated protein